MSGKAFDSGHLKTDTAGARKVVDGLVAILSNDLDEPQTPLLAAFKSIWSRLSQVSSCAPWRKQLLTRSTDGLERYHSAETDAWIGNLDDRVQASDIDSQHL